MSVQAECFPLGPFATNCYVVRSEGSAACWIVDASFDAGELVEFVRREGLRPELIVLTHAHEDHFGAVIELWPRLKVPVYATPFTAALLRAKLAEHGRGLQLPIKEVALDSRFRIGPFDVELFSVAHSIPESNAVAIRTPLGTVLHTGDWKLDPTPVIGHATAMERLAALGAEGVDAMVCDSTNAIRDGRSPSELEVAQNLARIIKAAPRRVMKSRTAAAAPAGATGEPTAASQAPSSVRRTRARGVVRKVPDGLPGPGRLGLSLAQAARPDWMAWSSMPPW